MPVPTFVDNTSTAAVIQWGTIEDTWNFCPSSNDIEYGFDSDNLNFTKSGNNDMYLWNTCTHTVILNDFWFGFEQEYFIMDVDTQLLDRPNKPQKIISVTKT